MKSWVGEGKKVCVLCGDECASVSYTLWGCLAYIELNFAEVTGKPGRYIVMHILKL